MEKALFILSDVMPKKSGRIRINRRPERKSDTELLRRCENAWEDARQLRETRERTMNYTFGDQWGDIITYKGGEITEREYIKAKGNVPLTNNIMVSIFNSVIGVYQKQETEPVCYARTRDGQGLSDMMSATLQANWQDTGTPEILATIFKDYVLGGIACARETFEEREGLFDTWTDYCNPNFMLWECGSDPRLQDMNLVGMLHDVAAEDLYNKFAKPELGLTTQDIDDIFHINATSYPDNGGYGKNDEKSLENLTFFSATNPIFYRVIECWAKRTKERFQCTDPIALTADGAKFRVELQDIKMVIAENLKRKDTYDRTGVPENERAYILFNRFVDVFWEYTFMAPDGTILCRGESPYEFRSHPFTIKMFPFVNGEVHPFMSNVIDQQRYINRLIIMHDMAAKSSAKGITIVPKSCIPEDMSPKDFADEFTEYDGIVFYETSRLNPNARPEVITSNAVQIGTYELLNLQLQLTRDITNVTDALQGKRPSAGTSAQRYALETQNATTSLYSLLQDMTVMAERIAKKKVSNIKQFYDNGRLVVNKDNSAVIEYDRLSCRDVLFKISIRESQATAAYQSQANDTALQLLQLGAIDITQYLQSVTLPFADGLLQSVLQRQQEQAQLGAMQGQQAQAGQGQQPQQSDENTRLAKKLLQQG